mgnify:CR=1 FL=1|tara:strand:- start:926 stop:2563 length:1638 start_codon:yes stop_codon:yes gene_type:complete
MNEFKEIANLIEKTIKKNNLDIPISVKFSNFSDYFDVQINDLVKLINNSNFSNIVKDLNKAMSETILVEDFEILDSGFVNIRLSNEFLKISLNNQINSFQEKSKEINETVLFDYGGANIGKSLHVGHIRTLNIGRSLNNIYKIAGYKTISDIHFGDWGMPIALILTYIEENNLNIDDITHEDLENIYPSASNISNTDKNFYSKAMKVSKELNNQDENKISQWKKIYEISTKNIKSLLNKLGFEFDYYLGESDVIKLIPDYIEVLKKNKLVRYDQGALISNDNQDPPALITKSDGSYMYLTTDIGTIINREEAFDCDKYIYVVDQRQKNHFEQLFKLVKYFKLSNSEFLHVGFGTVNDLNGKPLKTRDGENYKLLDLYSDIKNKLASINSEEKTVDILAKSVLSYSDLVTKRTSNYIFDLEKFTNVSGKSAIFIQYSQVRAKKLIMQNRNNLKCKEVTNDERPLIIELLKYYHYFNVSLRSNEPHHIAEYAYELCQEFNRFYSKEKIISDKLDKSTQSHKLFIVNVFHKTILEVFKCLGIEPVDEM